MKAILFTTTKQHKSIEPNAHNKTSDKLKRSVTQQITQFQIQTYRGLQSSSRAEGMLAHSFITKSSRQESVFVAMLHPHHSSRLLITPLH
jgi:hypothetical protein